MQLSGSLDCSQLETPQNGKTTLESSGIHLDNLSRVSINNETKQYEINIGNLDSANGLLPLATITREGKLFKLSIPNYSFLTLYYLKKGNLLCWSTHIGSLLKISEKQSTNRISEKFGLKYQIWPSDETVYNEIQRVTSGNQLSIDKNGSTLYTPIDTSYPLPQVDLEDENAVKQLIHDELIESLDILSRNHTLTGVMLGGFDSALIIALLAELGRPMHAVTLGYTNKKYNQTYITPLIKRYGFNHEWVEIKPDLIRRGLSEYKHFFDQPVTQPHYLISSLQLGKVLAEKGVNLAITGDGCDGVFFGYPTVLKKAKLGRTLEKVPSFAKRTLRWLAETQPAEKLAGQPARLVRQMLEVNSRPEHLRNFLTAIAVDNISTQRAFHCSPIDSDVENKQLESLYQKLVAGKDWIDITYFSKNMVGLNRAKLAAIWNHSGVQSIFSPYMMPQITALARAIPKHYWMSDKTPSGKYLLTRMAVEHGLLSKDIVFQKKMSPVSSPADHWYRNELKEDILRMLKNSTTFQDDYSHELVRERYLENLYKKHITIDDYASQALGMLLSYSRMVENT